MSDQLVRAIKLYEYIFVSVKEKSQNVKRATLGKKKEK